MAGRGDRGRGPRSYGKEATSLFGCCLPLPGSSPAQAAAPAAGVVGAWSTQTRPEIASQVGPQGSNKTSSSSTGTGTISTAYTSSNGTHHSSWSWTTHFHLDQLDHAEKALKKEEQLKHIKSLVEEFFGGDAGVVVVERWLTELGIGWVLHLADGASEREVAVRTPEDVWSWTRALAEIVESIGSMAFDADRGSMGSLPSSICDCEEQPQEAPDAGGQPSLLRRAASKIFRRNNAVAAAQPSGFQEGPNNNTGRQPDHGSVSLPTISEVEQQEGHAAVSDRQIQFAQFFQATMMKMIPFVDCIIGDEIEMQAPPLHENLSILLGVHGALSKALLHNCCLSSSSRPSSAEVSGIQRDMDSLLSAKELKVGAAIWSIMEQIRARILDLEVMEDGDDSSTLGTPTPQGSSGVHKVTQAAIWYFRFLRLNYSSLAPIVSAKHEPQIEAVPPLDSMIIEMASCLEEKLATKSESFPNRSIGFLFLLNNSYLISQQVQPIWSAVQSNNVAALNDSHFLAFMEAQTADATGKIRSYMEAYLQVSWAPVLSCLCNPTTPIISFGKGYSPLAKFESEFQKTYTNQKLCKVPDPWLRKILRKAITMKIMPVYTKYIEDNSITTPRVAPQELEEMLQDLFEG